MSSEEKLYELGLIVKKQAEVVEQLRGHLFGVSYAVRAVIETIAESSSEDKEFLKGELVRQFEGLKDQEDETARYLAVFIKHLS